MKKGHKQYLTLISDISVEGRTRIIAVLKGRTKDDIMPFLRKIPNEVLTKVQSICIDMSGMGCLNRLLSVDQFLDSRCQSRLSSAWRPRIFKEVKSTRAPQ